MNTATGFVLLGLAIVVLLFVLEEVAMYWGSLQAGPQCLCHIQTTDSLFLQGPGYGRYCGKFYGASAAKRGEEGCNAFDTCCKLHDECIGKSGYLSSCACNTALLRCITEPTASALGAGNPSLCPHPSGDLQMRDVILGDICAVDSLSFPKKYACSVRDLEALNVICEQEGKPRTPLSLVSRVRTNFTFAIERLRRLLGWKILLVFVIVATAWYLTFYHIAK